MTTILDAKELFDLTGEVALVTGASSGLGARFAVVLAAHGAKVVAAARRFDRLNDLARENPGIHPMALDVADTAGLSRALDEAERAFGPINLLVNNAGIANAENFVATPPETFRKVQATNVDAVWHLSQAFATRLIAASRPGAIINIASIASFVVVGTPPAYSVSKAAVMQMTRALALDLARHRIRVNAIAPGFIYSEMTESYLATPEGQEAIKRIPQRRAGNPSDLDGTLLLLASSRASGFMTGSTVVVDGGDMIS